MASVNKDSKGWRIEFTLPGQRRKPLRLGKNISEKAAREIGRHIERIVESKKLGLPLAADSDAWVNGLPEKYRRKLMDLGLVANAGRRHSRSLGEFLDAYVQGRTDVKPGTLANIKVARRWLEKYFGNDRDMVTITPGDADAYRVWLCTNGKQAENTIRRLCSRARQFFRAALRQRLITENPFGDMKKLAVGASPERRIKIIDRAKSERVLRACPDAEWRVIFALARFGGLRCPSELVPLRWSHVDWVGGKVTVTCVKTEHHEGHETRVIPLFPELEKELRAWRAAAPADCELIISRIRSSKTNLRTQLIRIIEAAGLKPWPKPFQNLRSSRETELMQDHPIHVVCAWMGNTPKVAAKHYLHVTDEDYRKARGDKPGRQAG